ncbi:MAG: hypothetical protein LBQ03_01470 [Puniceicoccales bacterium]|jgi:hypothetical protein|nr:hypothetical protein [Puniceicoccales bacterium]
MILGSAHLTTMPKDNAATDSPFDQFDGYDEGGGFPFDGDFSFNDHFADGWQ